MSASDRFGWSHLRVRRIAGGPRPRAAVLALLVGVVLSGALAACAPSASQTAAQQDKARLDAELHRASAVIGVPSDLLAPIQAGEQQALAQENGTDAGYQTAATALAQLDQRLLSLEAHEQANARSLTQADLQSLTTGVQQLQSAGYVEAANYASGLSADQQRFSSATSSHDYLMLDGAVRAQLAAVQALAPAFDALEGYQKGAPGALPVGMATDPAQQLYPTDLGLFRQATTAQQYESLRTLIGAETMQLAADGAEAYPLELPHLLSAFQARIALLKQAGADTTSYAQQYGQDVQAWHGATSLSATETLAQRVSAQEAAMALPLARAQAQTDLNTLQQLVTYAQTKTTTDPANGQAYPDAYEYANPYVGIGDAQQQFQAAQTLQDYQAADTETLDLLTNLRAMLDNLNDPTPHNQPHKTDLELMAHYGFMQQQVIVVSLREQTARLYDNGKMIYWSYVTTGAPATPSVPGVHYVMQKQPNMVFISPDPKSSPLWYAPTPIHYALLYANYGYYLHDAWWRSWFGPYSNLPHWDPAAFNGGSHGCINFPLSNMPFVYNWAHLGVPVIVY